jgi:hypothetical protein
MLAQQAVQNKGTGSSLSGAPQAPHCAGNKKRVPIRSHWKIFARISSISILLCNPRCRCV